MSEQSKIDRRILRIHPSGVQRVEQGNHVHFHHLSPDTAVEAGGTCEVEMCCHACGKAAIVTFSMSTIAVRPMPLNQRQLDSIRDEFVHRHLGCTRDEKVDYAAGCPRDRNGDHVLYDISVNAS